MLDNVILIVLAVSALVGTFLILRSTTRSRVNYYYCKHGLILRGETPPCEQVTAGVTSRPVKKPPRLHRKDCQ